LLPIKALQSGAYMPVIGKLSWDLTTDHEKHPYLFLVTSDPKVIQLMMGNQSIFLSYLTVALQNQLQVIH
jgi:hypothetical protein